MKTRNKCVSMIMMVVLIVGLLVSAGSTSTLASSKKELKKWNKKVTYTVKKGKFTFQAFLSKNKKKCWIYRVKYAKKSKNLKLVFPKKIKGATVTKLGGVMGNEDDFTKNIFNQWIEEAHGIPGDVPNIVSMKLPKTVVEITGDAFSGMTDLKEVKIPDGVSALEWDTFYGCTSLRKVTFSKSLKQFSAFTDFEDCPSLAEVVIPADNKTFIYKDGLIMSDGGCTLYWALPSIENVLIPEGVTKVRAGAIISPETKSVVFPISLAEYSQYGITGIRVHDISFAGENTVYGIDGQCMFKRSDKSLVLAAAQSDELVISKEVAIMNDDSDLCGIDREEEYLKRLEIPATVLELKTGWMHKFEADDIYFYGAEPPKAEKESFKCSYFTMHVPAASLNVYKKWARANAGESDLDWFKEVKWATF